jgi:type II secretory pathway pseudopilin PulG
MRTGEVARATRGARGERPGRGFTYVWLLFVLAVAGAALAALGEQWQVVAQREREAELLWRGEQFARALAGWRDTTPPDQPAAPSSLDELLVDERHDPPRRHLRRIYGDPFTGRADWMVWRNEEGRIVGLSSRSERPALRRGRVPVVDGADPRRPLVSDWLFEAAPAASRESSRDHSVTTTDAPARRKP